MCKPRTGVWVVGVLAAFAVTSAMADEHEATPRQKAVFTPVVPKRPEPAPPRPIPPSRQGMPDLKALQQQIEAIRKLNQAAATNATQLSQLQAADLNRTQNLQKMSIDFLTGQGFEAAADKNGQIAFKRGDVAYVLMLQADEPQFFSIAAPDFWPIEEAANRAEIASAAEYATTNTKCTKILVTGDHVSANTELLLASPNDFPVVFAKALEFLESGKSQFVNRMKKQE